VKFIEKHLLHFRETSPARPWRVGLLGLVHETNTFESGRTGYAAFEHPADREQLLRGEELHYMNGRRSVMGGMLEQIEVLARADQVEIVPLYRASAAPSALVEHEAWRQLRAQILAQLERAGPLDALLIELHGAMVAEGEDDCEGALLAALRERVGECCVMVASLDFHANVSPAMVEHADMLVPYRTYPHVDMHETGERCARRMLALLPQRAQQAADPGVALCGHVFGGAARAGSAADGQLVAAGRDAAGGVFLRLDQPLADRAQPACDLHLSALVAGGGFQDVGSVDHGATGAGAQARRGTLIGQKEPAATTGVGSSPRRVL